MTTGDFMMRQRTALRELRGETLHRSEEEVRIKKTYDTVRGDTEQRHDEAREELEASSGRAMGTIESEHRREMDRIAGAFSRESSQIEMQAAANRERITDKADKNEQIARKRLQDAIWATETVFEATEHQPEEQFEQIKKLVEENQEALGEVEEEMEKLLIRYRLGGLFQEDSGSEGNAPEPPEEDYAEYTGRAEEELEKTRQISSARWFIGIRPFALGLAPVIIVVGITGWFREWQWDQGMAMAGGGAVVLSILLVIGLRILGRGRVRQGLAAFRSQVKRGRQVGELTLRQALSEQKEAERRIGEQRDREITEAKDTYEPVINKIIERREHHLDKIQKEFDERLQEITQRRDEDRAVAKEEYEGKKATAQEVYDRDSQAIEKQWDDEKNSAEKIYQRDWSALESRWKQAMGRVDEALGEVIGRTEEMFPRWDDEAWTGWSPPREFVPVIKVGSFGVDRRELEGGLPEDERLATPGPEEFRPPVLLEFSGKCSLLLRSDDAGRERAIRTLQTAMIRLLTALPPGKVRFTLIDPVGLGQNFAGFMHLADYEEAFILDKIWTESRHIEQRLTDLTEHMENVIQKYLRNDFETIDAYNEQAGEIAEPYRFLVISDLPANISDQAAKRLASIVNSGPRCGVFTLIHHNSHLPLPKGLEAAALERSSVSLEWKDGKFVWKDEDFEPYPLTLDDPPDEGVITQLLHSVGEGATTAGRVEVPFDLITPAPGNEWSGNAAGDIRIPLGRAGAKKLQEMVLGRGTSQHMLIAGKTGSGKSTLLHALITNLALHYSPHEVQFYLVDFKKGVEFKPYATHSLAHARAVAIESDRGFGLSVLQRIDRELKQRGNRFRELGVQDLAGFREAAPDHPMPRILLIIDEFQEFFVDDDKVAQDASLLMDRLVRQGRAFGIHVILGSQTLGGAYSLARSTLGQMAIRVALQCSEADAYLIMSDDNAAARLLSRPGEAIYNDASGMVEGNSPFQVAWLSDEKRETLLMQIADLADTRAMQSEEPQVVFEGNVPADIERNHLLKMALTKEELTAPTSLQCWLGEAIAIKDPTAAGLRRHSGSHLLIVGQQDEAALAMLVVSAVSLAAQNPPAGNGDAGATFFLFDGTPPDAPNADYWNSVSGAIPQEMKMVDYREVESVLGDIAAEVERRQDANATDQPAIFLFFQALQRYRMLRPTDDFGFSMDEDKPPSPDKLLTAILRDGPVVGVHVLAWCDTYNNVNRSLDRQAQKEFELRVLFQMSGTDSAGLIDSPEAGKLGLKRALFFSEEQGTMETFRPYALPDEAWLTKSGEKLRAKCREKTA